ncbi:MAG: ATP-binding cassette domain-containing protein [Oscillospiraceae bacterium]
MVKILNLTFSYGEKRIFDGFTCDIDAPVTCIEAPSGAGKTTLLRLIAGLIRPDGGSIMEDASRIAYMFQEDRLIPWLTAEENVAAVLPPSRKDEASAVLAEMELSEDADSLPRNLSGGQCRRVALARALVYGGDLLLLDEPMKGLDPGLMDRIIPRILSRNTQIIMTSHSREEAVKMGSRILTLPDYEV